MCSLSSDLYTIKPKDHGLIQIKEMTEKWETKLFISMIKTCQITLGEVHYSNIASLHLYAVSYRQNHLGCFDVS
jgi:hypothetical protein